MPKDSSNRLLITQSPSPPNWKRSQILAVALVALEGLLVASNPYGPPTTYNDAYEPPQAYHQPAAPSYSRPAYHQPAPTYHAPAYPKYHAPSSAHHTQYDNYYPKQTYSKPMYAAPKPYAPAPMYQQAPPAYQPPRASYPAPSYGHQEEYKARA